MEQENENLTSYEILAKFFESATYKKDLSKIEAQKNYFYYLNLKKGLITTDNVKSSFKVALKTGSYYILELFLEKPKIQKAILQLFEKKTSLNEISLLAFNSPNNKNVIDIFFKILNINDKILTLNYEEHKIYLEKDFYNYLIKIRPFMEKKYFDKLLILDNSSSNPNINKI